MTTRKIPSRGSDQFNLRFPDGLRDRIRVAAEKNNRSMNAEIISRLEQSFEVNIYPLPESFQGDGNATINLAHLTPLQKAQIGSYLRFLLSEVPTKSGK